MKIGVALTLAGFSFVTALAGSTFVGTKIVVANPTIGLGSFEDASRPGGAKPMSQSVSTLLKRNLFNVFGENDAAGRRAASDEIDRVASALRAQHPDFRYTPIAEPEEVGNGGRIRWVEGRPGEAPEVAGTDFIIARDGRIAAIYFFFDKRP